MEDFRRFFVRGLAALLPTLVTIWLLVKLWDFLWESLGRYAIVGVKLVWFFLAERGWVRWEPAGFIQDYWSEQWLGTRIVGVVLAILLVYLVGVLVGNLLGRTAWRVLEFGVMRIPVVRAIYPAVKQVTDFLLAERKGQFQSSRVVACQPHSNGIWSVALVTGNGLKPLTAAARQEMITVFVPSSPTAFSGYVMLVPREKVVELPMTVEEAMRLLISGGVITPQEKRVAAASADRSLPEKAELRSAEAAPTTVE